MERSDNAYSSAARASSFKPGPASLVPRRPPDPCPARHLGPSRVPLACWSSDTMTDAAAAAYRNKYKGTAEDLKNLLLPFVKGRATWLAYYEHRRMTGKNKVKDNKPQCKNLLECPPGMWCAVRGAQPNFAIQREKLKTAMPTLWDECRACWPVAPSEDQKASWCHSMVERFHNACLDLGRAHRQQLKWVEKVCRDPEAIFNII